MLKRLINAILDRPESHRVEVIHRDVCRLRAKEWRRTPGLIAVASRYLNDPQFRAMLDVLATEHPGNWQLPTDTPAEVRAHRQAFTEGYTTAIATLESLALPDKPKEILQETFEEPEMGETLPSGD